jgi:hypothetical protein
VTAPRQVIGCHTAEQFDSIVDPLTMVGAGTVGA